MSLDNFTKYAKKKIDKHPTAMDADAMWANVQSELYPKKDRKAAWYWLALGGLILIFAYSAYQWNMAPNPSNNVLEAKPNSSTESTILHKSQKEAKQIKKTATVINDETIASRDLKDRKQISTQKSEQKFSKSTIAIHNNSIKSVQNSAAYISSKAEQNSLTRQLIEPKQEIKITNVPPINANINS